MVSCKDDYEMQRLFPGHNIVHRFPKYQLKNASHHLFVSFMLIDTGGSCARQSMVESHANCVPDNRFLCVCAGRRRKIDCSYELVELTDSLGDVGEESAERLRAELVAMLSCFLVCSCIMLRRD